MNPNPIPERFAAPAQLYRVARLSALPIAAVAGMVLAQIGVYISVLMYVVRAQTGNPLPRALIFAPDTGAALATLALPPAILLIRRRAAQPLSRRIAACLPLAGLFAAFIAVSLPGNGAWEYGTLQTFIAAAGRRGILECGMVMLLFTVLPKGKRGVWYGFALSAGFLWWRREQGVVRGLESLADTVSWYNNLYVAQIIMYCAMAANIVFGFAKCPVPEERPEEKPTAPEKRKRVPWLVGTLFLFYLANGFMPPRVFPAWMNGPGSWDFWQMHVLVILACPLYGLFLDRTRDAAKKLMTICSVFLMLAPTLNALSASPLVYAVMALYISESTVKTHIRNILSKLGAPNRTELLLRIIDPSSATPSMTNDLSCVHPKG